MKQREEDNPSSGLNFSKVSNFQILSSAYDLDACVQLITAKSWLGWGWLPFNGEKNAN